MIKRKRKTNLELDAGEHQERTPLLNSSFPIVLSSLSRGVRMHLVDHKRGNIIMSYKVSR